MQAAAFPWREFVVKVLLKQGVAKLVDGQVT
jgi:hypothetical protein